MKDLRSRKCKNCGNTFQKRQPLQFICTPLCAIEYKSKLDFEHKAKEWKKKKKALKEQLKSRTDYLNELQVIFNKYIRTRDKGKPCISCKGKNKDTKVNAGHFYSVGSYPSLRFNEYNCHLQCEYCNTYLHGNLLEYRPRIIKRIGQEQFNVLFDSKNTILKLTLPEIIDLKEFYKRKIKDLL